MPRTRIFPFLASVFLIGNFAQSQSLSDAEADAIILQQEQAKADAKAEQIARRPDFQVLSTMTIDRGDHAVIIERVIPPILPDATPEPEVRKRESGPILEAFVAEKDIVSMFLSGSVYGNEITEIRWQHEGQWVTAWSNVDFNHLRGVTSFDAADAHYSFLLVMDNQPIEAMEKPEIQSALKGQPEPAYVVEGKVPNSALWGLEAIHEYYAANAVELQAAWERSESIREARERYDAANPKQPRDVVIRYWPIKSSSK